MYLIELLTLFADKGVSIQNLKITNHHVKVNFEHIFCPLATVEEYRRLMT